jgi:CRP-like cAMP-binding protein
MKNRLPARTFTRITRHLRNHFVQKKFKESEELLNKIPSNIRLQIV